MATKKREYVSKSGKKVLLDISNMQKGTRPFRYVCLDADFLSDLATALELETATSDELLRMALKNGLPEGMNVNDYCFDRYSDKPVRNKSIHPEAIDNDTARTETKAVGDKTKESDLVSKFRKKLEQYNIKFGKPMTSEELTSKIDNSDKISDSEKKQLKAKFIHPDALDKKEETADDFDLF